jgi:hypothetical protein
LRKKPDGFFGAAFTHISSALKNECARYPPAELRIAEKILGRRLMPSQAAEHVKAGLDISSEIALAFGCSLHGVDCRLERDSFVEAAKGLLGPTEAVQGDA